MELNTIAGLPAHPLVVHGAVVLVPVAVAGFLAIGWRAPWSRRYGLLVLGLSVAGWGLAFLAAQSGEPLEEHVRSVAAAGSQPRPRFGEHPELGDTTALLSFVFAACVAAVFALERWAPAIHASRLVRSGAYVVTAAVGIVALVWMVRAGHTGAQLVWGK